MGGRLFMAHSLMVTLKIQYNEVMGWFTYLIIVSYSLSLPLESLHRLYITEASTFAGENVFGSLSSEIILRRIVLQIGRHKRPEN